MGLALACIQKGYKLICTISDKQSKEKIDILKAMGAEIYICPTMYLQNIPNHIIQQQKDLTKKYQTLYPNQYDNLSNRKAHYETTGPEIWEQTKWKITHFIVVGVGTGGTISGIAQFLKEKNPNIKIWGVDSYGSVYQKISRNWNF